MMVRLTVSVDFNNCLVPRGAKAKVVKKEDGLWWVVTPHFIVSDKDEEPVVGDPGVGFGEILHEQGSNAMVPVNPQDIEAA